MYEQFQHEVQEVWPDVQRQIDECSLTVSLTGAIPKRMPRPKPAPRPPGTPPPAHLLHNVESAEASTQKGEVAKVGQADNALVEGSSPTSWKGPEGKKSAAESTVCCGVGPGMRTAG